MKKLLVLITCILALALGAAAQDQVNFAELPLVKLPAAMPSGYYGFNWSNFYYVDPTLWAGAGTGYKDGLANQDVAFVGNSSCNHLPPLRHSSCTGVISVPSTQGVRGGVVSFQMLSASVAAGFSQTSFTVFAYNNGNYVGTSFYTIGTGLQTIYFPASWGTITEVDFQTQGEGDLVFYGLNAELILQ
jgi:hypothetical protein